MMISSLPWRMLTPVPGGTGLAGASARRLLARSWPQLTGGEWVALVLRVALALEILVGCIRLSASEPPAPLPEVVQPGADRLSELSLTQLLQVEYDTVYSASKYEQRVAKAPASVSILTAEEIKLFGYRTLDDVLRSVRGFNVTYDRAYSSLLVRGANRPGDYGGRVLINVDGHRMNDPLYDSALTGRELPLDVDLIERVEIIRGPGASLYGNNALLSVVNIVTRRGHDFAGVEASGAAASYDAYSGRVSYGNKWTNGLDLVLSGTWLDSSGHERLYFPEFAAVNNGYAEHLDGEHTRHAFASLSYRDFSLEGAFGDRRKDIPGAWSSSLFSVAPNFSIDERAFVELKYKHLFPGEWTGQARFFYDHYRYDGTAPYDDPDQPGLGLIRYSQDYAQADFWGGEIQLDRFFFERHHVILGGEFRDDLNVRQRTWYVDPFALQNEADSDDDNFGFFLQDEFALSSKLTLNAGVRYDVFRTFGGTVNPRAALIWSPVESSALKLLYGQAFRAPNAYERDYLVYGYIRNPDLGPEKVQSYECVWEQKLGSQIRLTGSVFYDEIHDLITQYQYANGDLQYRNLDVVSVHGAEVELAGRWSNGWRGRVSYMVGQTDDRQTHVTVGSSPRHLAKLQAVVPLYPEKVFAGLELLGMSGRRTLQDNRLGGVVLANLTLFSRELIKGWEASASIYNLLDRRYADPAGADFTQDALVQDGRTFRLKLTCRF